VYGILVRADQSRYGKLIKDVENDFLKGHEDIIQRQPTDAYNLLSTIEIMSQLIKELLHREDKIKFHL